MVRTSADPLQLTATVRRLIHEVNHNAVVSSVTAMEQLLDRQMMQRRFQTWLIGVFSALALALAALGVFAVMHYSVAARASEIGIRMAVGANAGDIIRLVLSNGTRLAFAGIALGAIVALWATEALAGMLYNVRSDDPISLAAAALTLFGVALLASYLPAHRAAKVDPLIALRHE